jgi:hypothetical protein
MPRAGPPTCVRVGELLGGPGQVPPLFWTPVWVADWPRWRLLMRIGACCSLGCACHHLEGACCRLGCVPLFGRAHHRLGRTHHRLGRARCCLGCAPSCKVYVLLCSARMVVYGVRMVI